jgi:hypothetical protein
MTILIAASLLALLNGEAPFSTRRPSGKNQKAIQHMLMALRARPIDLGLSLITGCPP